MSSNDEKALTRALSTLREVTQKLTRGVEKSQFEDTYRGRYVSPGISVRRHVEELHISGSLEETNGIIKLRQTSTPIMA